MKRASKHAAKWLILFCALALLAGCDYAPTADSQTVETDMNTAVSITLTGSDADGDELTFALQSNPRSGTLSGSAPNLTYTPNTGFSGTDFFTFTVNDGRTQSQPATVSITVKDSASSVNTAPTANDQSISMRAAELLARPITLAGFDADGDALTYTIVTPPASGRLIGSPPRVEYLPDSTFVGQDTFTYRVEDTTSRSRTATVTIDVALEPCTSDLVGGPVNGLFLHVPSHVVTADISANQHTVTLDGEVMHESASSDPALLEHVPFVSRNDLTDKTISIDLNGSRNAPMTVSFKLIPASDSQSQTIMQSGAFAISDGSGTIRSTVYDTGGGQNTVTNDASTLKIYSCNHFALVVDNGVLTSYLNGEPTQAAANTSSLRALSGALQIGPYAGEVWDIRIYERALTPSEILQLADTCADAPLAAGRYDGYPNYLCRAYVCEWWPDGTEDTTMDNYRYYVLAQNQVYERNMFEAGMVPEGDNGTLSQYILVNDTGRNLMLGEGIRSGFVNPHSFDRPLVQGNSQHWLHENFHSFQGRLTNTSSSYSGSKVLAESSASWGATHNIPASYDTLLGFYTLQPHLPVWTRENSPVDGRVGEEFKGGHQYGANIFWSYLTNYVVSKRLIGDVYKDGRPGVSDIQSAYDFLAAQGHDLKEVFADFAARITTWDILDGEAYADSELGSLNRMKNKVKDAENPVVCDAKITATYGTEGTGNQWARCPAEYSPGPWAFNAYEVEVSQGGDYIIGLKTDASNPGDAEFRARIVVHDLNTDARTYYTLKVAEADEPSSITVPVLSNQVLYLVVSVTPEMFDFGNFESYQYQYKMYPKP